MLERKYALPEHAPDPRGFTLEEAGPCRVVVDQPDRCIARLQFADRVLAESSSLSAGEWSGARLVMIDSARGGAPGCEAPQTGGRSGTPHDSMAPAVIDGEVA